MRMFLASTLSDTIDLFVLRAGINNSRVLFVANPADPFKSKRWVNKDRKAFLSHGFEVEDVDFRRITSVEFKKRMKEFDILHICGGSALYILKLLKDKKMFMVIKNAINNNQIIYTGTSAGSMIMAPNISFACDDEDEQKAGMVGKLKDMDGIGLSPFYIMCHAQEKEYIPSTIRNMNKLHKNKLPILFLNDNMALWFEGKKIEFLKN